jgi:hypothetical protein
MAWAAAGGRRIAREAAMTARPCRQSPAGRMFSVHRNVNNELVACRPRAHGRERDKGG